MRSSGGYFEHLATAATRRKGDINSLSLHLLVSLPELLLRLFRQILDYEAGELRFFPIDLGEK
jgi:hypothetical protein